MAKIDWDVNSSYVIERVLSRGTWKDFKTLLSFYGMERVKTAAIQLRYLDKRTLAFCSVFFHVPIEKFRCYNFQQSNPGHWEY